MPPRDRVFQNELFGEVITPGLRKSRGIPTGSFINKKGGKNPEGNSRLSACA